MDETTVKRGRGRPKMTEEQKIAAREKRLANPPTTGLGGKHNFPNAQIPDTNPGDNSRYIRHALATLDMPPIDISDPKQVSDRLDWYFMHCASEDMKPTVTGFCNSLGITKQSLFDWKHGNYRAETHQAIIVRAYKILEELWENYMQNGKINPVAGIFLGKNNFGYADKQEYVLTPNTTINEVDVSTVEAKYAELPDCEE